MTQNFMACKWNFVLISCIKNIYIIEFNSRPSKYTTQSNKILLMKRQCEHDNESFAIPMMFPYGISRNRFSTNFKTNSDLYKNSGKFMTFLEDYSECFLMNLPIKRSSVLFEPLQKFILVFHQHGHMAYAESKWMPIPTGAVDQDEPQVLTINMLAAGFVVWLICVLICIVVFLLEVIIGGLRRRKEMKTI